MLDAFLDAALGSLVDVARLRIADGNASMRCAQLATTSVPRAIAASDCARLLLDAGADLAAMDAEGRSALALARLHKQHTLAEMLLEADGAEERGTRTAGVLAAKGMAPYTLTTVQEISC